MDKVGDEGGWSAFDGPACVWCGSGCVLAVRVPTTLLRTYILPPRTFHAPTHTCAICLFSPVSWHPLQNKVTPLHVACDYGHTVLAIKLVELGADVNAVNEVGPLGIAASLYVCGAGQGMC